MRKLLLPLLAFLLFVSCKKEMKNLSDVEKGKGADNLSRVSSQKSTETSNCVTTIKTVTICNRVWMANNLDVSKYRNGDVIPQVADANQWINLATGAWCFYELNSANGPIYGKLYNWYAVNDPRGLAPAGWHIPSDAEWTALANGLGGVPVAGGKMKETGIIHWYSPNTNATNSSGFTGLPGGDRTTNGAFDNIGAFGYWWSSTANDATNAWHSILYYNNASLGRSPNLKIHGFSVRCVKD